MSINKATRSVASRRRKQSDLTTSVATWLTLVSIVMSGINHMPNRCSFFRLYEYTGMLYTFSSKLLARHFIKVAAVRAACNASVPSRKHLMEGCIGRFHAACCCCHCRCCCCFLRLLPLRLLLPLLLRLLRDLQGTVGVSTKRRASYSSAKVQIQRTALSGKV